MLNPLKVCNKLVMGVISTASILFVLTLGTFAITPVGNFVSDRLSRSSERIEDVETADYIVVLGGDIRRIVDAARLYDEGLAEQVILSGGYDDHITAAQLCGIEEDDIIRDSKAATTADHPRTIAELEDVEKDDSLIIVTSGCHFWRARRVFEKAGYDNLQFFQYKPEKTVRKIGVGPKGGIEIMYEFAAILKYKIKPGGVL